MDASVLRKIKKPLIEKKRRDRINQSLDQLKIILLENVKKKEPQVSRLDKAEILEMTVKYLQQLPKQDITFTAKRDDTIAKEYKSGYEECIRKTINFLKSANGITHDMKSRIASHLSSCIGDVNDLHSPLKYSRRNSAFHSPLGVPVKSSYFTPLYVDIPSSTQYPSTTARTLDSNRGLLMPLPGYPVIKTEDPYSPYYYPTLQIDSSVCATQAEDPLLNQSSGYSSLNEQSSQGLDSSACRLSLSNSVDYTSVTCDQVWRPW